MKKSEFTLRLSSLFMMRIADGSNLICLGFLSEIHGECKATPVGNKRSADRVYKFSNEIIKKQTKND